MEELPALPDAGWSSIEKAFCCRALAINLLQEAERRENCAQAEELAGVALRWLALARFHEAESARTRVTEPARERSTSNPNGSAQRQSAPRSRRRHIAED